MKVTLDIEPSLVSQLKAAAKQMNTSISKIAEPILKKELDVEKKPFKMKSLDELPEWVRNLSISGDPVPDFDHKAEYGKHLEEKYGL